MPESHVNGIPQPAGRPFPWFCPRCRKKEVRPATVAYQMERLYDGRLIAVDIPNLDVPQCGNCGEQVFDYGADEQILDAVRTQAAVPHPAS